MDQFTELTPLVSLHFGLSSSLLTFIEMFNKAGVSISLSVTRCLEMGLVDEEGVSVNSTRGFLVSLYGAS